MATFYIDPTAKASGTGSLSDPLNSWSQVNITPGNSYLQKAGTTAVGNLTISALGTATTVTTIGSYGNGAQPVINGLVNVSGASYVTVEGIAVSNSGGAAIVIQNGSNHISILGNSLTNSQMGLWIGNGAGADSLVQGNTISGNALDGMAIDKIANLTGHATSIIGNTVTANGIHGIEIDGNNFIVNGNTVSDNGLSTSGGSGIHVFGGFEGAPDAFGVENTITNNVTFGNRDDSGCDGNGIELDQYTHNNVVSGNLAYGNDGAGLALYDSYSNSISNNLLTENELDPGHTHAAMGDLSLNSQIGITANNVFSGNIGSSASSVPAIFINMASSADNNVFTGDVWENSTGGPATQIGADVVWADWQAFDRAFNPFGTQDTDTGTTIAYNLTVTGALVSAAAALQANAAVTSFSISDSSADVSAALAALAADTKLSSIALTDTGTPTLGLTAAQYAADAGVLAEITSAYNMMITLTGSSNEVASQTDVNVNVTGGVNSNAIFLGDGNDSITLSGTGNHVQVGGGTDTITAGSGHDAVVILGADSLGLPAFVTDPTRPSVPSSPNDIVNLAGADNTVNATYENVTVNGAGTTGGAIINIGNGQNNVFLGGNTNYIFAGNGTDTVAITGNYNYVIITDPTGVSAIDAVSLSSGTGNTVSLDHAGGQVIGTDGAGATTNTVLQAGNATNNVNVDLLAGTGIVILGNGSDQVMANGAASFISLGNGNDTVTANGNASTVIVGTGNDTITANGNGDSVTVTGGLGTNNITADGPGTIVNALSANGALTITANGGNAVVLAGNGADTIAANGAQAIVIAGMGNDSITAGGPNGTIIAGNGNDTVVATGSHSTVNITAGPLSVDNVTMGTGDVLRVSGGTDQISGVGNDFFFLNNLKAGSTVLATGSQNFIALGGNSSTVVTLDPARTNDTVVVQSLGSPGDLYTGLVEIKGFTAADMVDLQSLAGGVDGNVLRSWGEVQANLVTNPTSYTLKLAGGGAIQFDTNVPLQLSQFGFSNSFGLV
jgi:parallel beta-helix repeat protein